MEWEEFYFSGFYKFFAKDYNTAILDFNEVIKRNDQNARAYLWRGCSKYIIGDTVSGVGDLRKAEELDPNLKILTDTNYKSQLINATDYPTIIITNIDREILVDSTNCLDYYYESACRKSDNNDHKGALLAFNKIITLDPNHSSAIGLRGLTFAHLGDVTNALSDFDKGIILDPDSEHLYFIRGNVNAWFGKHKESIPDYTKSIELCDRKTNSTLDKIELAVYDQSQWPEIIQTKIDALYCRGFSQAKLENHKEAVKDFSEIIINLNEDHEKAHINRGCSYAEMGDYLNAFIDFDWVIEEINPENSEAYTNRGIMCNILKDYKKAIQYFNTAIELEPENAVSFFHRGISKFNFNLDKEAITDLSKAKKLGVIKTANIILKYKIFKMFPKSLFKEGIIYNYQKFRFIRTL